MIDKFDPENVGNIEGKRNSNKSDGRLKQMNVAEQT